MTVIFWNLILFLNLTACGLHHGYPLIISMPTKFFTNKENNSLLKKFEGVFANIESIRHFDALVGYFRTSGYFKLRAFLDKIPKIRILVGINVDQLIKKYHSKGQMYLENPEETKEDFLNDIIKNIQEADYDEVT